MWLSAQHNPAKHKAIITEDSSFKFYKKKKNEAIAVTGRVGL
jgi:hypothetical protein